MNTSAVDARSGPLPLLRRPALVIAAAVSVATVVLLLPLVVLATLLFGGAGVRMATRAHDGAAARRASLFCSIGLGLTVGPAVYLLLAVLVRVF